VGWDFADFDDVLPARPGTSLRRRPNHRAL